MLRAHQLAKRIGAVGAAKQLRMMSNAKSILTSTPDEVVELMLKADQHRGWLVYDGEAQQVKASHTVLEPVAEYLNNEKRDFDRHEAVFLEVGPSTRSLYTATVHNTTRGQGSGGVRFWPYATFQSMLHDGLRLSQGMGRKNSLAGLWWGGGKGIIARQDNHLHTQRFFRDILFQEYGQFITGLRGAYYTAEDVGCHTEDIGQIFSKTRFSTSIPTPVGGSGNPSVFTAHGVVCAMEGVLDYMGKGTLAGKTVAVQGLGNVASPMIARMLELGVAKVIAADINPVTVQQARDRFAGKPVEIRQTVPGDLSILYEQADIIAPCALGGVINSETIPNIKAKIICGAANNQLLDSHSDDQALARRGIIYVPDFLANRMGIVNCANEPYGYVSNDPAIHRHFGREWENSIFVMVHKILKTAETDKTTTSVAANKVADHLLTIDHPIWPKRTQQIIQSLVSSGWHAQKPAPAK